MKKFLYFSAAALTTLFAASCSSEEPNAPVVAGEGATFTINLPADLQTRATFGNGLQATNLHVAVYPSKTANPGATVEALPVFENGATVGTATFNGLKTKIDIDLPHGVYYNIVFFACNDASKAYTFDEVNKKFTVNYENMKSSYTEANDCFVYTVKDFMLQGPKSTTVTLYRPVAQLNVGTTTTDFNQAVAGGLDINKTKITVSNVYKDFMFLEGGDMTDKTGVAGIKGQAAESSRVERPVDFGLIAMPGSGETFPYVNPDGETTYKYLSMNYVLVGNEEKDNIDVTFKIDDNRYAQVAFNNVPMQRNHRTNIFGNLFTSPAEFNVVIDPIFDTPDFNYTQEVAAAEELANALAEGKIAKLTQDITVDNLPQAAGMKNGMGSINLNNHTLTVNNFVAVDGNLTVENGTFVTNNNVAFDMKEAGNLTLNNVKGNSYGSFVNIKPLASKMTGSVTINNCELTGRDFIVSTNANQASHGGFESMTNDYHIYISGSKLTGCETPVMVNIPISVTINNSVLVGKWQAMLLRGGFANLNNNTLTTTCEAQKEADITKPGQGNNVPRAALTVMNGGVYNYAATANVNNCKINGNDNVPAIFAMKGNANLSVRGAGNTIVGALVNYNNAADIFDVQ